MTRSLAYPWAEVSSPELGCYDLGRRTRCAHIVPRAHRVSANVRHTSLDQPASARRAGVPPDKACM